ncbi:MAG: GNAT family N-acetyltransferase [Bacteroidetes bacterium]|nr:MAG: GNAT family N-acetyltransferase [Bacteroidota bacterium]
MEIREVQATDNAALAGIIRWAFEEHDAPRTGSVYSDASTDNLFDLFQAEGSRLLVGIDGGEIAGCCGIYPTEGLPDGCVELVKFYLRHESRGKGLGRRLLEECISLAGKLGYREMYIESFPEFGAAVGMYELQGFHRLDHPMGQSGHTSCTIWMLRSL